MPIMAAFFIVTVLPVHIPISSFLPTAQKCVFYQVGKKEWLGICPGEIGYNKKMQPMCGTVISVLQSCNVVYAQHALNRTVHNRRKLKNTQLLSIPQWYSLSTRTLCRENSSNYVIVKCTFTIRHTLTCLTENNCLWQ